MAEKTIKTISNLRSRAKEQKIHAYASVFVLISIVILGFYIFVNSAKIAVLDIKAKENINNTVENTIRELADKRRQYDEIPGKIDILNREYTQINEQLSRLESIIVEYFDKSFHRYETTITYNKENIDDFKNRLNELNKYYKSPNVKDDIEKKTIERLQGRIDSEKSSIESSNKQIESNNAEIADLKENYPTEVQLRLIPNLEKGIQEKLVRIQKSKKHIKSLEEQINNESLISQDEIEEAIKTNSVTRFEDRLKKIQEDKDDLISKRNEVEKYINYLTDKKYYLDVELNNKHSEKNNSQPNEKYSNMFFFVSSNIARFGIIVITLFFAQVFFSIYKYSSRLYSFYCARADALELLVFGCFIDKSKAPEWVEPFSKIFTPDGIDFGKNPSLPIDEIIKLLNAASK